MYSLEIELLIKNKNQSLCVFNKNNQTVEDCLKESLKWRLRPFQKTIKKIYIFIKPLIDENVDDFSSSSPTRNSINYSSLTTQSTFTNTIPPQNANGLPNEWDDHTADHLTIKKKISFACYGKFLNFLKTYCFKNEAGSFKIVFILDDLYVNSCSAFHEQLMAYQTKIKQKILGSNIGVQECKKNIVCQSLIGLGAFGVVFKSTMPKSIQKNIDVCAIKVIPLLTISNVSCVHREIYILNLMSQQLKLNPYVVNYYGSFIDTEYLYIVMEYLPGPSLNHFILANNEKYNNKTLTLSKKNQKECIKEIQSIVIHLSKCLFLLHELGISHRDIKPGNIMADVKNNFKMVDFGFAALQPQLNVQDILKWDNKVVGTYRFSPPEVLSFEPNIDWLKADYWSLGTVLYFVVTGKQLLDKSSKDRHEMLNILHKRLDTVKPLHIPFYNIFDSTINTTHSTTNTTNNITNNSTITQQNSKKSVKKSGQSLSAPAPSCNKKVQSIL